MTNGKYRSKLTHALFLCSLILFAAGLLIYAKETSAAATQALVLCAKVLIPSLFPFLVVSTMAIDGGVADIIGKKLERPMKFFFNLPGVCASAFVLGLIGGYPVGATNAIYLYKSKLCSKTQAERLLAFCNNCGSGFVLGVVGVSLFGSSSAGALLYISHIAASLVVGLIFRFYKRKECCDMLCDLPQHSVRERPSFAALFTRSVKSSALSVLNVCSYVIFFSVAVRLLFIAGFIPFAARFIAAVARPLDLSQAYIEKLISGLFEFVGGVQGIVGTGAGIDAKLSATAFLLGWAGMSVHFQVLDFMCDSELSPRPYIIGKLLHGFLSSLFVYIGASLIPFDIQVSKTVNSQIFALADASAPVIFISALSGAVLTWAVMHLMARLCKRKSCVYRK